jgi:hypothetical protein
MCCIDFFSEVRMTTNTKLTDQQKKQCGLCAVPDQAGGVQVHVVP